MSPTRRQVVSAVATGAVLPTTVTAASARQEDDDQGFSPEITFSSNNLVATIGERDGDVDPDTVTIYTADGSVHEFDGAADEEWRRGEAFDVGYTYDDSRARVGNWHGILERVEATKDGETVSATNEGDSSLQVSCSLWQTPDEPPTEFTALSEGARKQHWNRGDQDLSEDQRQYGSPGRPLWTVAERSHDIAMRVDFVECEPEAEKALWFDCTTVTVTEDELNQGEQRIEDVQLTFNDDTTEHPPGTADEADNGAYELPVTLSGSGENDGKVIKKLHFKVERGEYTYWNLEAEQCSAEQDDGGQGDSPDSGGDGSGDDGSSDDGSGSGDGGSDSGGDGSSDDGSGSDDGGSGESTETPAEEPSSDDEPTATPESTDSGGSSGGGSGGDAGDGQDGGSSDDSGGGSTDDGSSGSDGTVNTDGGSGGSGGSDGSTDGSYQDDTDGTPTPRSVEVGTETADASRTATADGAGTGGTATASPNGSGGSGNATVDGADGPVTTEGVAGEDQPGMGFVSALGGLLGLGELARRRLDGEAPDAPDDEE